MKKEQFEFNELPYPTLAHFGLTQEMIEDSPLYILKEIGKGGYSPVLPVRVINENDEVIENRSQFTSIHTDSGEADAVFYPTLKSLPLERYDEGQQKQLLDGKSIIADVAMADGRRSKAFVQIDEETRQVMYIPTLIIVRNLEVLVEVMYLGTVEANGMRCGEPLTAAVGGEPVTAGIDFHNKTGIRSRADDAQRWKG